MRAHSRLSAVLALGLTATLVAAAPSAVGAATTKTITHAAGPRGLDVGPGGSLLVAKINGVYGRVVRGGDDHGKFVRLGTVPETFIAPALDMNAHGELFVLTPAGPPGQGLATLYRWKKGEGQSVVADIAAYQETDPDPYDLEKHPEESNPYGLAALDDGSVLVADAAGNDLLHVTPEGDIHTVATVKPRTVKVPKGLGEDAPPAGTPMPSEAVITAVTVGADGYYYIGELRGFPATPRTSQIWRVHPNAQGAVCDPENPYRGQCRRVVGNMTSVVGLDAGAGGSLYVVQLSDAGWLKAESGNPKFAVGSLIRLGRDRGVRHEFAKGRLVMPGDVALDHRGRIFVTTPVFGRGRILRVL